jgi:flagellar hook-associated protein 3
MRITHRMIADTVNFNLQRSLNRLDKYSNQLSTGKVFQRPSENPVGVGRVMSYTSAVNRNEQFRLNMNQTSGWLDNSEFSLQNGLDALQRIRELSIYGANESLTAEDRRAIAPEVLEFINHLVGVANTETNGLYIFGGHQTLKAPFIRENTYHTTVNSSSGLNEQSIYAASDMQNGKYTLDQSVMTASPADLGSAKITQSYLQGNAESIIGSATLESTGNFNSSILLEVTGINAETGQVDYAYEAHEYALDGSYLKQGNTFSLNFGGAAVQPVTIGSITLNVSGMNSMNPANAAGLRVGDRSVINVTPAMIDTVNYDIISLNGEHRGGNSGMVYSFNDGVLDGTIAVPREMNVHYFSLDSFDRSPTKGDVFDGNLNLTYNNNFAAGEPAITFSYDSLGFPVYYGDNNDRIQEISPHQEMTMNLSGDKAFGENQEVFEAVIDVYWALMDNDREALGDSALAKMDDAVNHFLEKLAQVGARSNRVEAMHNTLFSENLYLREVRSNIEDIDLAYIISEFKMQESAYKAALSTASMMLQPSLVDYLR